MNVQSSKGFTKIELIVVLSILTALCCIAIWRTSESLNSAVLRKAILAIDADIRRARWTARTTTEPCEIQFDVVRGEYTVAERYVGRLPEGVRFGADPAVTGRPGSPYTPPPADGITFDSGNSKNIARFYPTGIVAPTGAVYVTDGKSTLAITVAITGRPKCWRSLGGRKWAAL